MSDDNNSTSSAWHGGKGSLTRKSANHKAYSDNWDKIFGKKDGNNKNSASDDRDTSTTEPQQPEQN